MRLALFANLLAALLAALLSASAAQAQLCPQIQALIADPSVASAHWGISVTNLDGTSLCAIHDRELFRPASNAKLFTVAAALAVLGPTHTFETRVSGDLKGSTITGDLTLAGGGDPSFQSTDLPFSPTPTQRPHAQDLEDLARQLVAKGVRSVAGDIVGDDTLYPYEPYGRAWNADDFAYGYSAPVSALTLGDNQLRLTVTAGVAGGRPAAMLEQGGLAYYTLLNQLTTGSAKASSEVEIERTGHTLRLSGSVAAGSPPDVEEVALDDPAAYAAQLFRATLLAHGIAVTGSARARHRMPLPGSSFLSELKAPTSGEDLILSGGEPGGSCATAITPPTLATHTSAPLAQDVVYTLKLSANLHAELYLHALGRRNFCRQGGVIDGARFVRAFLLHVGVAPDDFLFYDGSGLSSQDLVTPRATTTLLAYASTQPWFAVYKAALPLGGSDGTLIHRFTGPLKGRVFAKTGTLGETRALSGYLTANSGQTLAFSILVDTHMPGTLADRSTTDKLLELIAAAN